MKMHMLDGGPLFELKVLLDPDHYAMLERFVKRLARDGHELGLDGAASSALSGALARMELFKDPP